MATAALYDILEALRSTLSTALPEEKTRLSLTQDLPAASDYLLITPSWPRSRQVSFPALFVVPWPDGGQAQIQHESTGPTTEWEVPVAVELVFRASSRVESDVIKDFCAYTQMVESGIVNNSTLGRSDVLAVSPQSVTPSIVSEDSAGLWASTVRTTLGFNPQYL